MLLTPPGGRRTACGSAPRRGRSPFSLFGLSVFGPALVWKADGIGGGYSSPIVVGDAITITGDVGEDLVITALDLDGKVRWHVKTGEEAWSADVLERFGAKNVTWGISESLAVLGRKVFVTVAGAKALMAALDGETGRTIWTSPPLPQEKTSYATPVLDRGSVFITTSSRGHNALYRLRLAPDGAGVERVWSHPVKNGQGGLVLASGGGLAFGCSTHADGRIYYLSQDGEVALLEPVANGARIAGRFRLVQAKPNDAWAHPVIAKGRLYLRYGDSLYAYDVKKP
ncbi:MAG: PQQ-binding-like beta-propeller repeat protein [Planctomycetes bacterium]|nr:PQQ-binding-like beta-propeller repeat protein [Planctomycetota bacterium]